MSSTLTCPLLLVIAAHASAVEWNWNQNTTPNQTHARERVDVIPSIYGDVRRPLADAVSAYPLPRWTSNLSIGYEYSRIAWASDSPMARKLSEPLAANPDRAFLQTRQDLTLRWTGMTGWSWLGYELELPVSYASPAYADDQLSIGDLAYRLLFPVLDTRYSALTLVVGGGTMIPTMDTDPVVNHGYIYPQAGLRMTVALGMVAVTSDTMVTWAPVAYWDPQDPQAGDTLKHDYRSAVTNLLITWRPTRWLRTGINQRYQYHDWNGDNGSFDMTMVTAPTLLVAEVTPIRNLQIGLQVGADFFSNKDGVDQGVSNRLNALPVLGFSLTHTF